MQLGESRQEVLLTHRATLVVAKFVAPALTPGHGMFAAHDSNRPRRSCRLGKTIVGLSFDYRIL